MEGHNMTRESIERFVLGHVVTRDADYQSRAIALKPLIDRMHETGECLLHATAQIHGGQCYGCCCYDYAARKPKAEAAELDRR